MTVTDPVNHGVNRGLSHCLTVGRFSLAQSLLPPLSLALGIYWFPL